MAVEWDKQRNTLPNQQRMPMWDDSSTSNEEVRHYEQYRRSDNELTCSNIKVGTVIKNLWSIYLLYGICDSTIDLTYYDKTVAWGFSVDSTFQSDGDPFYGVGLSFIMHEGNLWNTLPVKAGIDIKYRRFDFEVDTMDTNGTFYAATLDEIQMALLLSADTGFIQPYIGARISSTTGKEHYMNQNIPAPFYDKGYIDYEDDITWSKNMGYVIGAAYVVKEAVSINVELRFGDEEAMGCSASVRF
ncbi:hypothetical protein [Desulfoluna limicola]|nr:hypothetical protein [Desulfoluna limicola]